MGRGTTWKTEKIENTATTFEAFLDDKDLTLLLVPITVFPERGHDYKRTEQEKI
jgi:hypothetical protein